MAKKTVLITGANGEIGHSLIGELAQKSDCMIVALDLDLLDEPLTHYCYKTIEGDILDKGLIDQLGSEFEFDIIYHLAALLSTNAERQPERAQQVNVFGTVNLLGMALNQAQEREKVTKFLFPSSIAVYGMSNLTVKSRVGKCKENEWLEPITMYGINKLYCEHLGKYYSSHYRQLDADVLEGGIDFRAIRFPGLISAITVPTGGTSDYIPEMLHCAAQGKEYVCFVREDTRLPFMAMPDAVKALLTLSEVTKDSLSRYAYNVTSFNPSACEFYETILGYFPDFQIKFLPDAKRQIIVDSWPADLDDSAARADWGMKPVYDLSLAVCEYLIPTVSGMYKV